jgi:hypothetical protein
MYLAGNRSRLLLLAAAITAAALIVLLPSAALAGTSKPALSVRLETGTQAKALETNRLRVRVVASRATRVRLTAVVRKTHVARPTTVSLQRRKGRTVSLRLSGRGRKLLAAQSRKGTTEPLAPARPEPLPPCRRPSASRLRGARLPRR